jgi:uncharacterized protein YndB with AHSA1/START domain
MKIKGFGKLIDPAAGCEIVTRRTFNVPRALLYKAWTDPHHLKKWWGPNGFTNTFNEFDLREGGKWSFIMHGPEKGNYPNEVVFLKIREQEFIAWDRLTAPAFQVQVMFNETGAGKSEVVFKMVFADEKEYNKVIAFVPGKNEENMDRLEAELKLVSL